MPDSSLTPAERLAAEKRAAVAPQPETMFGRVFIASGLTYADVTKATGVSLSILRDAVLGELPHPRVDVAMRLARFFGKSVEELFGTHA